MGKTRVALIRCDSYSGEKVVESIKTAIDLLGGAQAFIPEDRTVLIKPNMLFPYAPSRAVTTHPEVVAATAGLFKQAGANVIVGDSPGRGDTLSVAEKCGIASACSSLGIPIVPFEDGVSVKHPAGHICKEFILARPVLEAGSLINVAKMKTHGFMTYTGAVKNLFGCISGLQKMKMHLRYNDPDAFSQMLLDLLTLIKPRLSLVDAVIAMDGDGPSHGRIRPVGAILASDDAVAIDAVSLRLVNCDPMQVPYLRVARDLGIGNTKPEEIEIIGDSPENFHITDFEIPPATRATSGIFKMIKGIRGYFTAHPRVDPSICVGCRACAASCPPQAIKMSTDAKAIIDDKTCIRCFCCHEMCPEGAISLSRGFLARLAERVLK